jgi:hypothetical protein
MVTVFYLARLFLKKLWLRKKVQWLFCLDQERQQECGAFPLQSMTAKAIELALVEVPPHL